MSSNRFRIAGTIALATLQLGGSTQPVAGGLGGRGSEGRWMSKIGARAWLEGARAWLDCPGASDVGGATAGGPAQPAPAVDGCDRRVLKKPDPAWSVVARLWGKAPLPCPECEKVHQSREQAAMAAEDWEFHDGKGRMGMGFDPWANPLTAWQLMLPCHRGDGGGAVVNQ